MQTVTYQVLPDGSVSRRIIMSKQVGSDPWADLIEQGARDERAGDLLEPYRPDGNLFGSLHWPSYTWVYDTPAAVATPEPETPEPETPEPETPEPETPEPETPEPETPEPETPEPALPETAHHEPPDPGAADGGATAVGPPLDTSTTSVPDSGLESAPEPLERTSISGSAPAPHTASTLHTPMAATAPRTGLTAGGVTTEQAAPTADVAAPVPQLTPASGTTKLKRHRFARLAVLVVAVLAGGAVGAATMAWADRHHHGHDAGVQVTDQIAPAPAPLDGTITAAALHVEPSVVTLSVSAGQSTEVGSGTIVRRDGYILTNDHVISAAARTGTITVILSDGRRIKATIAGRDPADDLAVIKASGVGPLTAAAFGRSASLAVGQAVVAVGAPLGLSETVTSGIVSSLQRPIRSGLDAQAVFDAVQTDAAISAGNSGGPLIDLNGTVVGISTATVGQPASGPQAPSSGISFAIGSEQAARIAGELIATGRATHAVLGISIEAGPSLTGPATHITSLARGGPAAKAGLKVGDVLTQIGGIPVSTADGVLAALNAQAPRAQVTVSFVRMNTAGSVRVVMGSTNH